MLRAAVLASNAALVQKNGRWAIQGDPTEGALIVAARKIGVTEAELVERYRRVGEVPFSSERKMMSVALTDARREGSLAIACKGAPDVLLERCTHERRGDAECPLTPQRRADILALIDRLAEEALRTLGVAYRSLRRDAVPSTISEAEERDLVFLGVVGMIDPPRPEAAEAVWVAQQAGVRSIMITGDHPTTAVAIAAELGIVQQGERALTGTALQQTDGQRLRQLVEHVSVFARVAPEHKLHVVRALKDNDAIVAMTGDGVNDAPALKAADIGVAMGLTGTDVAKGAADMILTDDNFASIVAAVEEGRTIFANIQKFLRYLLSSNIGEVLVMFGGVVLARVIGLRPAEGTAILVPLLSTHILWINLLTDAGPALALGVEPADPRVMTQPPRDPQSRVINRRMWFDIFFVGIIMMLGTLGVMDWALPGGLLPGGNNSMRYAQTLAFTTLVFFQLFNAFNARSDEVSAFTALCSNPWLWLAVGVSIGLQIGVIYLPFLQQPFGTVPLSLTDWAICIAVGSTVLWLRELWKLVQHRRRWHVAGRP